MKNKSVLDAMKKYVEVTLDSTPLDLLVIGTASSTDESTGEVCNFIQLIVEVPRGYEALSRCQFKVKIPNGVLKLTNKELDDSEYFVTFKDLVISYVDSKGNVYFRASDYDVTIVN